MITNRIRLGISLGRGAVHLNLTIRQNELIT